MNTPETSAIVWGSRRVSYTIHRSARRKKTVAVTVEPSGSVLVIAPERLATARLDAIVTRKAEWIVRRLRRAEGQAPRASPREFVSGESVLYLGRHYRLKVDPRATGEAAYSSHRERGFQSKLNSESIEAERSSKRWSVDGPPFH